jgi:hypothetical protein
MRLVYFLWSLSLIQFAFSLITPSVFAVSLFTSFQELKELSDIFDDYLTDLSIFMIVSCYLIVYALWVARSYTAENGKISEGLCSLMVFFGMMVMIPIYTAIIWSMFSQLFFIHYFILFVTFVPVFISFFQSATSAILYIMYLPYFMMLAVFFLVYVPSYSYAR